MILTWSFSVIRKVLDEEGPSVYGINFAADAMVKFGQLANQLSIISSVA